MVCSLLSMIRNWSSLLAVSAFFFMQPQVSYELIGTTEARIAIVRGTPQAQADIIRFGEFEGGEGQQYRIRSAPDAVSALDQIESVDSVSGAFVPAGTNTKGYPVIWQTTFLPDKYRNPALAFAVFGFLLLTLTIGGAQHKLHPLAVGAEFFVDTIRGIPMLVIKVGGLIFLVTPIPEPFISMMQIMDNVQQISKLEKEIVIIGVTQVGPVIWIIF